MPRAFLRCMLYLHAYMVIYMYTWPIVSQPASRRINAHNTQTHENIYIHVHTHTHTHHTATCVCTITLLLYCANHALFDRGFPSYSFLPFLRPVTYLKDCCWPVATSPKLHFDTNLLYRHSSPRNRAPPAMTARIYTHHLR